MLESEVVTDSSGDGSTYSVRVHYRYQVAGQDYESSRYSFVSGSSSGRAAKQRAVDAMPAGAVVPCWVDPDDPKEAVIRRGLWVPFLLMLLPLVFVVVGVTIFVASRRSTASEAPSSLATLTAPTAAANNLNLTPEITPRGKFLGLLTAAVIWNGITAFVVAKAWSDYREGALEGGLGTIAVVFALVGAALLLGVPYQFLALWNPRPSLRLEPEGRLILGEKARLRWRIVGGMGKVARLRLTLIGEEVATYRRGTSSYTDREVFERRVLLETTDSQQIQLGEVAIELPNDTMHSFDAPNNKIVWKLELHGEISRRPDVSDTYPLTVVPARRSGEGGNA